MAPRDQLIVALDYASRREAMALVDALGDEIVWYKVGLELYLREDRSIVQELRHREKQVFLDLKLHDIPNTVARAVRSVASSGAAMLTVHAGGGPEMLHSALMAAMAEAGQGLKLLAVTVLTSMDEAQLEATGVARSPAEQVMLLGEMALETGLPGLVCSADEVELLRGKGGPGVALVVPGIRGKGDAAGDQRRTASAAEALRRGASQLVVGRPITRAAEPLSAARAFLQEIGSA